MDSPTSSAFIGLVSLVVGATASADVRVIGSSADNTLYEDAAGSVSNGAGTAMFAGLNAQRQRRRAVLRFDVAAAVPAGATILSARMRLYNSATNVEPRAVSVHRLLESWGEAASDAGSVSGGGGVAAETGDATWVHRFSPGDAWSQIGGVFSITPAAQAIVTGPGFCDWSSSALTADVASFLATPADNAGWILVGDESLASSVKRFATREEARLDRRPQLIVEFIPTPGTASAVLIALGLTASRRRR